MKTAKSTSVRWDIYTIHSTITGGKEELAELLHTEGQGMGIQNFIAERKDVDHLVIFEDPQLAAFERIMNENKK